MFPEVLCVSGKSRFGRDSVLHSEKIKVWKFCLVLEVGPETWEGPENVVVKYDKNQETKAKKKSISKIKVQWVVSNNAKRTCKKKIKIIGLGDLVRSFLENSESKC